MLDRTCIHNVAASLQQTSYLMASVPHISLKQRWEFIKENKKIRILVFLFAFLVEFLFPCFLTFLFSFINCHLSLVVIHHCHSDALFYVYVCFWSEICAHSYVKLRARIICFNFLTLWRGKKKKILFTNRCCQEKRSKTKLFDLLSVIYLDSSCSPK